MIEDLFKTGQKKGFSTELFENITEKYVKEEITEHTKRYIIQGDTIPLEDSDLPLFKTLAGPFDLHCYHISNVEENSKAYQAGVRNGQRIIGYEPLSFNNGRPLISLKTHKGLFKFEAENNEKREVFQLHENLNADQEKRLNKFFGAEGFQEQ